VKTSSVKQAKHMSDHRFIAAMDHSGGSTGGVLERYGQEYTEENKMEKVHAMRLRMVNSPDFNDSNIWGAILYQDTVTRGMVNVLDEKGIDTFLKVDSGCEDNGMLKEFDVRAMCEWATNGIGPRIYGTKMRSIIKSESMIGAVLKQQFELAHTISEYGLVPIVEPEVPIDHPDKAAIEDELYRLLEIYLQGKDFSVILKLTPPETPNLYHNLTVKHNVEKVVFLSGGYATQEACRRLSMNNDITASFSRALSEGLAHSQTDAEFNAKLSQNIKMITGANNDA
jgi:fructose-bisphosphate aldolase class I